MKTECFRLLPGDDLYLKLQSRAESWQAGCVLVCVGSLSQAFIRLAGAERERLFKGPFEIVSLTGTGCATGLHLHISLSDRSGSLIGGHLKPGSIIETTAEVVIGLLENTCFTRIEDSETGYLELDVRTGFQASS